MGKGRYRRKIQSLRRRIQEHRGKIGREWLKSFPDETLIRHWEREIQAFEDGIERARKRLGRRKMKAVKAQSKPSRSSGSTEALLLELAEECQRVLKLLAQLEMSTLTDVQRETVLGDLSAAVLHIHEHTRGLDSIIDSKG